MARKRTPSKPAPAEISDTAYDAVLAGISGLLERARHSAAQTLNAILTATYWEVGRRVVEFEQRGQSRAAYGERLWKRLADDLTARHGRGFSKSNLALMRAFYLHWEIFQTPSGKCFQSSDDRPSVAKSASNVFIMRIAFLNSSPALCSSLLHIVLAQHRRPGSPKALSRRLFRHARAKTIECHGLPVVTGQKNNAKLPGEATGWSDRAVRSRLVREIPS
jgi:hypothetical protein